MAAVNRAWTRIASVYDGRKWTFRSTGLLTTDFTDDLILPSADVAFHVYGGTFGATANVVVEGKCAAGATTYSPLRSPDSVLIGSITAETLKQILEAVYLVRFRVSGGDGTTTLTVDVTLTLH